MDEKIMFRALRKKLTSLAEDRAEVLSAALSDTDAKRLKTAAAKVGDEFTDDGLHHLLARIANSAVDQMLNENAAENTP